MSTLPVGRVQISSTDPPLVVSALLTDEKPTVEDGYGGWNLVERPRRMPLTTFKSLPARTLTLPILLDDFVDQRSIEAQIATVEKFGRRWSSNGEPPRLTVSATGGAVPLQDLTWVCNGIAFGDAEMNEFGNRCRQYITLSLVEYMEDVYLQEKSAAVRVQNNAKAATVKKGAAQKRVTVKTNAKKKTAKTKALRGANGVPDGFDGEDLLSIAARELGDADRWLEIAQLNGLRDPRAMREGQVIRLP